MTRILVSSLEPSFISQQALPVVPTVKINEVGDYVNEKVGVTLHVIEQVDSGTKLDFLMPIFIPHTMSTGKTTTTYL